MVLSPDSERSIKPRPTWIGRAASFGQAVEGAAAVEFAFLVTPLLLLIAGILQCAFILWAGQNLDAITDRAIRKLTTGSFQTSTAGVTDAPTLLTKLKTEMCGTATDPMPTVFTCSDVKINVKVGSSFGSSSYSAPVDTSTKAVSTSFEGYACPRPGQIVVVTAAVPLPAFFNSLLPMFSTLSGGLYLLQSTAVFRTEPYTTTSKTCN